MSHEHWSLPATPPGWIIAIWGIGGVCAVIIDPIVRLGSFAWDTLATTSLTPMQWVVLLPWCAFMLYTEGWRGFHLRFAPRVVVRALALAERPRPVSVLLAPLMCMGLIDATRRRLIVSWALVVMIVALVIGIRLLSPPWRAVIDVGVVLGLSAGLASILWFTVQAVRGRIPDISADLAPHRLGSRTSA